MTDEDIRKMVKELLNDDNDTLSSWECDFLDDMNKWTGRYTTRQVETIERIYEKVFP